MPVGSEKSDLYEAAHIKDPTNASPSWNSPTETPEPPQLPLPQSETPQTKVWHWITSPYMPWNKAR